MFYKATILLHSNFSGSLFSFISGEKKISVLCSAIFLVQTLLYLTFFNREKLITPSLKVAKKLELFFLFAAQIAQT